MNEILLSNEVIVFLLSEMILYCLLFIAFVATIGILKKWDFNLFTSEQFRLENRSYLIMTIVLFSIVLKVILLPYFVYMIDNLSNLIPGAMCGAGVIKANEYGNSLLVLKIGILFFSGVWLSINTLDLKAKNYPYLRLKAWLFIILFILLSIEFVLNISYLLHIETHTPVSCCSVIFGQIDGANTLPLGLDISKLLMFFYLLFLLIVLTILSDMAVINIIVSIFFLGVAYYSIVYFFGTYIYQLPTHKCPFCMLQDHYYYVGYFIWGLLLLGVFFTLNQAIMKIFFRISSNSLKRISLLLLSLFVLLCSTYVGIYYFKNGVFL